ncbi:MAG: TonB-dependent receptor [Bacteroidia bacterium]|nr:TonB-dependent receptor [Bacteroidia bacterium]
MKKKLPNLIPLTKSGIKKILLTMKLALIIVFLSVLQVSANVYSQITVNLNVQDKSIREVLKSIEQQSQLRFFYSDDLLVMNELIDVKADNKNITGVLDEIFSKSPLTYKAYDNNLIVIVPRELLQQQKVTGTVTGKDGTPVPGVNVVVTGTTLGTITDIAGKYSIEIPQGSQSLTFTFIGMEPREITIGTLTQINVIMAELAIGLEEVVVVGYGTQKRSDITGSVVSLGSDILKERPQTNLAQALQGNMAGITVTTSSSTAEDNASILIRGQNSITASSNPLIVLDGVPYEGGMSTINTNDIERLDMLKDASSTAIYGSRGANGVILITTKQGSSGKVKISYDGSYSLDYMTPIEDIQDAGDQWKYDWERGITVPLSSPSSKVDLKTTISAIYIGDETKNTFIAAFMEGYPGQTWTGFRDNILSKYPTTVHDWATLQQIANEFAYPEGGRNTDWIDFATRVGYKQQHNISISGGDEDTKYYISGNFSDVKGISKGDDFTRSGLRFNINQGLLTGVKYGTNTSFNFMDRSGLAVWDGALTPLYTSRVANAYNEDGSIDLYPVNEDATMNPLEPLLFKNEDFENEIITNHYLDIDIPGIKGLHYKFNAAYHLRTRDDRTYRGNNTREGAIQSGILNIGKIKASDWLAENILSYTKNFGRHSLFLTGLYSAQARKSEQDIIDGMGFANDVMTFYQASKAEVLTAQSSYSKSSYISQMLRANYGFDKRYMFTATVRRDGFSAFGNDTKFGIFPSIAVGWNITNEGFLENLEQTDLKLRLSYGKSGNEAIEAYSKLPLLSSLDYINQNQTIKYGYYPQALSNPDLGWETTKSLNLGVDFSFFSGKIKGSLDAYTSNTYDLLLNETISSINGTTSILRNIGETKNHGLEFQISTVNISTPNFSWRADLNFTYYKSKIVNVGMKGADGNYIDDVASGWFIGQPVDVNFDYEFDRILQAEDFMRDANGEFILDAKKNYQLTPEAAAEIIVISPTIRPGMPTFKDVDGDGTFGGSGDMVLHGDRVPDVLAGITNTFKYNNWTFSFFFNGVWGVTKLYELINTTQRIKANIPYWTPENPTTEFPGLAMGNISKLLKYYSPYFSADYVRLQDVTLSYTFPVSKWSWPISQLETYVNVKNVYTFSWWPGMDPEYDSQLGVPRSRNFVFGLRMSF